MDKLILLLLATFPFGQLLGSHVLSGIIFFMVAFTLVVKRNELNLKIIRPIIAVSLFSLSLSFFSPYFDPKGLLYFFRLLIYLVFFSYCLGSPFAKSRQVILSSLAIVGIAISIIGWIQYAIFPDLTGLKYMGWDDHYFRLTSSFIDPAFTGIILTLAVFCGIFLYLRSKNKLLLLAIAFMMLSLGFTYSRASFTAFIIGLFVLLWRGQKKLLLVLTALFVLLVTSLPQNLGGEGVNLSRTNSFTQKLQNYTESIQIIEKTPLFGVGYNNVCKAKVVSGFDISKQENSCYGLDNSFLLIFATTGVLGLIGFLSLAIETYKKVGRGFYGSLILASGVAVLFHSLFTNTLFYPWVIVWLALLVSVTSRRVLKL